MKIIVTKKREVKLLEVDDNVIVYPDGPTFKAGSEELNKFFVGLFKEGVIRIDG